MVMGLGVLYFVKECENGGILVRLRVLYSLSMLLPWIVIPPVLNYIYPSKLDFDELLKLHQMYFFGNYACKFHC